MGNLALDNKVLATISTLAEQMKTTKEDIVKKAVNQFAKTTKPKNRLMKFAGILEEEEADKLLETIYSNRQNKDTSPTL